MVDSSPLALAHFPSRPSPRRSQMDAPPPAPNPSPPPRPDTRHCPVQPLSCPLSDDTLTYITPLLHPTLTTTTDHYYCRHPLRIVSASSWRDRRGEESRGGREKGNNGRIGYAPEKVAPRRPSKGSRSDGGPVSIKGSSTLSPFPLPLPILTPYTASTASKVSGREKRRFHGHG